MFSLTHLGANFRTKPLSREQAERFARCLQANSRFTEVNVNASRSPGKFTVHYQPASDQRYRELLAGERAEREVKAVTEGSEYVFVLDKDGGRAFFHCLNPKSGEVYETTEHGCSCPDYT